MDWTDEAALAEEAVTGRKWKDCPVCGKVRLPIDKTTPCQDCGGEAANCRTCGTGSRWWYKGVCSVCHGDPVVAGSGIPDWKEQQRRLAIQMFGHD